MACNIALSIGLYEWFLTVPPNAASAAVTLINFTTIALIIYFGREILQQVIQVSILSGFVILDMFLLLELVNEKYEIWLSVLYGLMFITIAWSAWDGVGRFIKGVFTFTRGVILSALDYCAGKYSGGSVDRTLDIKALPRIMEKD